VGEPKPESEGEVLDSMVPEENEPPNAGEGGEGDFEYLEEEGVHGFDGEEMGEAMEEAEYEGDYIDEGDYEGDMGEGQEWNESGAGVVEDVLQLSEQGEYAESIGSYSGSEVGSEEFSGLDDGSDEEERNLADVKVY
jgi:hypothetical protein